MSRHRAGRSPRVVAGHVLAALASFFGCLAVVLFGDWTGDGPLVQPWQDASLKTATSAAPSSSRPCVPSSSTYPDGRTWHACDPALFRPAPPSSSRARSSTTTTTSSEVTPPPAQLPTNDPFSEEDP